MTPSTTQSSFASGDVVSHTETVGIPVLVCLPPLPGDVLSASLAALAAEFPAGAVVAAIANALPDAPAPMETYAYESPRAQLGWVLGSGDYIAASHAAGDRKLAGVILLGTDPATCEPTLLAAMAADLHAGADLVLPRYQVGPHDGLVNSALLYPITRALFGADAHFPLPVDAALSPRLLQRLASAASRQSAEGLSWPVAEAAASGYAVREVDGGARTLSRPAEEDLNKLLSGVAASLFTDVEAKAAFWQRSRVARNVATALPAPRPDGEAGEEMAEMVNSFRLAYVNLLEIWTLVLPPQTLLVLKKLSLANAANFYLQPDVWARVVYDFALAFHLRTLNRGHLLGALTPLYLAWVASHVRSVGDDIARASQLVELTAAAFEREKPYLVSRWRWPDRFNP